MVRPDAIRQRAEYLTSMQEWVAAGVRLEPRLLESGQGLGQPRAVAQTIFWMPRIFSSTGDIDTWPAVAAGVPQGYALLAAQPCRSNPGENLERLVAEDAVSTRGT